MTKKHQELSDALETAPANFLAQTKGSCRGHSDLEVAWLVAGKRLSPPLGCGRGRRYDARLSLHSNLEIIPCSDVFLASLD
jgi:hypothetical protein